MCDAAVTSADHVTDHLERGKNSKHAAACDAVGLRFVAAAFTTLGGWGRTVRKQLHTLYAKKKKEERGRALVAAGAGSKVGKKK